MIDFGETYSSPNYEVRDTAGALANAGTINNPAGIQATITLPDGTTTNPTLASPSTGIYNFDYLTTQAGRHQVLISATGGILGSLVRRWVDTFDVSPADPGLILSLAWAKTHLNLTGTVDDEELRRFIAAATKVVEGKVGSVVRHTVVDQYDGGRPSIRLRQPPVISITSVAENGTIVASTGYKLSPDTGLLYRVSGYAQLCWVSGFRNIDVTHVAGRVDPPENISLASEIIVQHLWETQRGGTSATSVFAGEETVPTGFGFSVPRRALELLEPDRQVIVL